MAEDDRRRKPHHTGDPEPPGVDPDQPDPTWGDEGGGGEGEREREDERPRR